MRVIAGLYKKHKLIYPKRIKTRPMMDAVKESIFNMLSNHFNQKDYKSLDIFAGSGQLGIEALSRGAAFCWFNDWSQEAQTCIKANLSKLKVDKQSYKCTKLDFKKLLNLLKKENLQFDLVLLDPPFKEKAWYYYILEFFKKHNLLSKKGIILCEADQALNEEELAFKVLVYKKLKHKHLYLFHNS